MTPEEKKCPVCGTTPCKIPKSPEAKVEGMPTREEMPKSFTLRELVDAQMGWTERFIYADLVLAALTERDREIERLKADALDMEYHNPILHADIPSFTDRAKITFRMLEQEIRRLKAQLSALQSTPGMEREKALEEAAKVAESDGCTNSGCYGDEHTMACPCGIAAAIRALARPAEGKEGG